MSADDPESTDLRQEIARNQETIDSLNRALAKRTNDVRIIQQISSEITSTLDLREVLEIVLGAMERVLGFQHSMLLLAEPAGDALVVAATRGYAQPGANARVRIGDGVIGVVAERRTPMRVGNVGVSLRYLQAIRARMQAAGQAPAGDDLVALPGLPDVQSQLALPLLVKDRLVGVLAVESLKPNAFDELDEVLLRIVSNQAATAIDNASKSSTRPLYGLGVGYDFSKNVVGKAEWTRYDGLGNDSTGKADIDTYTVGVAYKF